ncbi:hypothetical protein [Simiduia agarivorans]|uniref:Uncharacterized protein n=1 Tax=Simiduia agarivorans (strain DSM 21679 / JCM 13881 / BCRC 17597 / SA1) TaxID=1117647 RepID=K4KQ07_SIMAS|nr:hypothetical protein [Simiduia agarivorans]AFV00346.1 hypothetical protein M5M_16065 [Simiduia agarivorans SA1 = DSM 21679]
MKQLFLLASLALITPATQAAGQCDAVNPSEALACFDRLAQCAVIQDDDGRLACYRAGGAEASPAAQTLTAASPRPVAEAPTAMPADTIEQAYPVAGSRTETEDAPVLTAKVVKLDRNAHKYYFLWLDNGHIWREKERSRFRYKVGDSITISKGAFGANQLKLEGKTGMVLVERVK